MPLQKVRWTDQGNWRVIQGWGDAPSSFIPGETMPIYVPTIDFTGNKNVGNIPGVPLTLYQGTQGTGVLVLSSAGTFNNIDFGNRMIEVRADITFNNCRGVLTRQTSGATGNEHIRILNGSPNNVVFNDCEFHNRAQASINGLNGRNFTLNRCVFTGHTDEVNNASSGSAPVVHYGVVNDCWLGDQSWWRWSTTGVVHPSDTQTHNDSSQTSQPGMRWFNTFFGVWPSEWVGTGTPDSGTETNPHSADFAATYTTDQATMNSWRSTYLNTLTRADQSFGGIARKSSTGGSWAGVMGTLAGGGALQHEIEHCYFSGGTVHINESNTNLSGDAGFIHQCIFWNDMTAGHTHPTTVKGTAIYVKSGLTLDCPTSGADANHWFDGTVVSPTFV